MDITINEVQKSEEPILLNLVKMSCYEWSQYNLFDVNEKGEYPFEKYLPMYFENSRRHCFFVKADGILAGFALIDDDFAVNQNSDYSMGEFFVMYKYRRNGIGKIMAEYLFNQFRGKWEVGYHPNNIISQNFWLKTIGTYMNQKYCLYKSYEGLAYHDGSLGNVITFDNSCY